MIVRSFCNTDIPSLCSVWNEHYGELAPPLNGLRLEFFSLAKPYFDNSQVLVAEEESNIVGFLHYGPTSDNSGNEACDTSVAIFALCVLKLPNEDEVAAALLRSFQQEVERQQIATCRFRPSLPDCAFYLGLGPADSIAGATTQEVRLCKWLANAGFAPHNPTCLWELSLSEFKPPIDRMQIQIRRAAAVNQQLDEPVLPWWQACVLGHTEPTKFQLIHRLEKRVLCDALFWSLSHELQTEPRSVIWLWPKNFSADETVTDDHITFLLAESFRQFQVERLDLVRTAVFANDDENTATLRKLGFHPVSNGMIFERQFD